MSDVPAHSADRSDTARSSDVAGTRDSAWPRRVAVLGVGLLGGSVALALRRAVPGIQIIGTGRSERSRRAAEQSGAVDRAVESATEACRQCQVVVVATPVDRIAAMVVEAAAATPADCLITDVGSTKATIVNEVARDQRAAARFVAAHPIAGGEKRGAQHAVASLFRDRTVVLTPSEQNSAERVEQADSFWRLTGARTVRMPPAEHDAHLAATSHVPHLIAALLARLVRPEAETLVGTGWRDTTRIAAGDPDLWTAIVRENRRAIAHELQRAAESLGELQRLVESGSDDDALRAWLAEAKQIRDRAAKR